MNQISIIKTCSYQGHQEYQVIYICPFNYCVQNTRWCCLECLAEGIHQHQQQDNHHIMDRKQTHLYVMKQYEKIQKVQVQYKSNQSNLLKNIIKECLQIQKSLIDYRNQYYEIQKQIQNILLNIEQCLSYTQEKDFQLLNDYQITQILNIDKYKLDLQNLKSQFQQPLYNIKQKLYQIDIQINQYQDNLKYKSDYFNQINDIKQRKYVIQEIDQTNNLYHGSSISKNEQYLAYGGDDKMLKIYDIKLKRMYKQIKLNHNIYVCQFNEDSQFLYIGLSEGFVYGYDVQDNFKDAYNLQISLSDIYNIITIKNEYLITSSKDYSIIKTQIKTKEQIFKLNGHTNLVIAIDYNKDDDIIVSGSYDKCIQLWNCKNQQIIINKEQSHNNFIRQIQLINKNQNILSLDTNGNLYKWQIDLKNKDLIKLQQFSDQNEILNFYQVNQDQNIILICNSYVKILNQSGETLNKIEHDGRNSTWFDCRQLDNIKYIQIRAESKIVLYQQKKQFWQLLKIEQYSNNLFQTQQINLSNNAYDYQKYALQISSIMLLDSYDPFVFKFIHFPQPQIYIIHQQEFFYNYLLEVLTIQWIDNGQKSYIGKNAKTRFTIW